MDGLQGFRRGQSIRAALDDGAFHLLFEAGHPDFKKLVEVGAERAKELDPFQQRRGRVQGLFQHALVELQPAQFAIEQVLPVQSRLLT
jgi:hypothetical protein